MRLIIPFIICIFSLAVDAQTVQISKELPWSVRMADSELIRNPKASMLDFASKPKWNYTNGLVCSAMERVWKTTNDEKYYNYIKGYADEMISEDGLSIETYKLEDYNIDKVNSGKFLIKLYEHSKNSRYEKAIRLLRDQMRTHPRTTEGGFWHKKVYPHQMWLDGLYMGTAFLAQYAKAFNESSTFDDVALQIILADKHTFDPKLGLFVHAWDESKKQQWANKEDGKSPHAWGRAMGWYAMALVDVLDYFPKEHPKYHELLGITNKMAQAIAQYQDARSGVWHQVMDQQGREGNYLEASASCMFTYFLVKAVKNGYIDKQYFGKAKKGYDGILKAFIKVDGNGTVNITQVCAVAGLGGTPYRDGSFDYYVNEQKRDNDPKAVGPFIMLANEFETLKEKL